MKSDGICSRKRDAIGLGDTYNQSAESLPDSALYFWKTGRTLFDGNFGNLLVVRMCTTKQRPDIGLDVGRRFNDTRFGASNNLRSLVSSSSKLHEGRSNPGIFVL